MPKEEVIEKICDFCQVKIIYGSSLSFISSVIE
jgi:hypothetical protein